MRDQVSEKDRVEIEKFKKYLSGKMSEDEKLDYEGFTEEEKQILKERRLNE